VDWLLGDQGAKLEQQLNNPRANYSAKFEEFRKRIEPRKTQLPAALQEGLDIWLNSVADLLRATRNDAGHPTGRAMDRDDQFINLQMFARYLLKLYGLKAFFESGRAKSP
jgi:hypothetical protein